MDAKRVDRRHSVTPISKAIGALPKHLPLFKTEEPLRGANNSTQYAAVLGYTSLISGQPETIKIEVSLREPLETAAPIGEARTILLDPVTAKPLLNPLRILCISRLEAFAEKFRAALSRREPAIRDFFDLDYACRNLGLQTHDKDLSVLVRKKLAVPGNTKVDVSSQRKAALQRQLEAQLRPVLREKDWAAFDLDCAFKIVSDMASLLE
jgi:hypothetical protein